MRSEVLTAENINPPVLSNTLVDIQHHADESQLHPTSLPIICQLWGIHGQPSGIY
jgi:hypothetical protein